MSAQRPLSGPFRDSVWLTDAERDAPLSTLPSPGQQFDVAVVGGGLAGLLVATRLLADGARVVVLEAGRIAGRTTGHSTAKLTALHGIVYQRLRAGKGVDAARQYAEANSTAVDEFRSLIATLSIDCDMTVATAYTCSRTPSEAALIDAEVLAAQEAGLPVYATTETDLPWPVHRAVALDDQARLDPVACCVGLVRHLRAEGVVVAEDVRVTGLDERDDHCIVRIGEAELRADLVVQATHLPIVDPAFIAARTRPERSYVVSGPVATGAALPDGMYLSVDEGWSVRRRGGGADTWLLVGGEDHSMLSHVSSAREYARLSELARERFGVEVRTRWSAFDYVTTDGVPFIGRLAPWSRRCLVATGFAKWGMSTSMLAATILGDRVAGRGSPYDALFDSTRIAPTIGKDIVRNNAHVVQRFIGDRVRARGGALDGSDLEPGAGVVVRSGLNPIGVARRADGTISRVKAVCTHLGCVVQFNDGEQTWDCPCHGSRFDIDGAVIDGPAIESLEPFDPTEHVEQR